MGTLKQRFTISPDVCAVTDEDGSIILDVRHDKIYSLIGIGSFVWKKLATSPGATPASIIDDVRNRFLDVSPKVIEADVSKLLESFCKKGIVTVESKAGAAGSTSRLSVRGFTYLARVSASWLFRLRLYSFTAFLGLGAVNVVLKTIGFQGLCAVVKDWPCADRVIGPGLNKEICEAVKKAASWYPKQSMCLQRSAVITCLLRHRGIAADLVIGCRKIPFGAHAWVEVDGEVANDKKQVQRFYKVLSRF